MTKWSLNTRGWSPASTCPEYEKLKLVAEELLAHVGETTLPEQFEQVQKGLLFYWEELKEHIDPLHPRFPGGHRCLDDAYLHYAMLLRAHAALQKPLPPPPPPAPPPKPRSLSDVLKDLAGMTEESSLAEKDEGE